MTTLTFDVFWRDRGVSKGLKDLGKDAETGHKHVKTLSDFGPKLLGAFAGFAAADVFHSWIEGARESNRIARITQNVIASTGGAAHVTADQVGDLATAISNKTGADDEAVQSGQNMLLTFTNVRNEVGKGNDIFNQASGAVVDLAAAMNNGEVTTNGVKTASIQLGKALNDPIKGVTALRKVGVSFTAQQTDQIKTLVQSGHTLEAQKIILREVGKEFGGTAAAAADPLQKLSVIAGNLGEQVGNALLPAVTEFADFMANTGAPALSRFLGVMQGIPPPAYAAAAGLVGVVAAVKAGRVAVEAFGQVSDVVTSGLRLLGVRAAESAVGVERAATSTERAATSTGTLRSRAGGLAGLLGGPYGLALAGAVGVVGLWAKAQADARQRIEDLTGAIKDDSGALGEHSRKLVVDRLESDGVLKAAEKLGLNLDDVTNAALGNADATDRINGQLSAYRDRSAAAAAAGARVSTGLNAQELAARQVSDAISGVNGDVREATDSYKRETTALGGVTAATNVATTAQHGAAAATNIATTALHAVTVATTGATAASKKHRDATVAELAAMDANADGVLSLRSADRDLAAARADLTDAIRTNKRSLDLDTAAGRANSDVLDRVARSTREDLAAHRAAHEPMRLFTKRVRESEAALIDEAKRAGMSNSAAKNYARAILAVPRRQVTDYVTRGLIAARNGARLLAKDIANINGKTVRFTYSADGSVLITARQGSSVRSVRARAGGGPIEGYSPHKRADNLLYALTADEHVWSVDETRAAGGHAGVARLRKMALGGRLRGLAAGGPVVNITYSGSLPTWGPAQRLMEMYAAGWGLRQNRGTGGGGGGAFPAGPTGGGNTANKALGRSMAANLYGWTGGQWNALDALWMGESGWNNLARNPSSGAFGIPQALPPGKMGPAAAGGNAWAQIMWGLRYIHDVYGTPAGAYGKWLSRHPHWYESGGLARGAGALLKGPRPERMLSPRQTAAFEQLVPMLNRGLTGARVNVTVKVDASSVAFQDKVVGAVRDAARSGRLARAVVGP
jgi:hypothetical protein